MASDRSTLEGKDRAELTVIAQAMGNKVGSRMRKAQIIDLIVGPEPDETAAKKQAETQLDFSSSVSTDGSADDRATGDAARSDDDTATADADADTPPTPSILTRMKTVAHNVVATRAALARTAVIAMTVIAVIAVIAMTVIAVIAMTVMIAVTVIAVTTMTVTSTLR